MNDLSTGDIVALVVLVAIAWSMLLGAVRQLGKAWRERVTARPSAVGTYSVPLTWISPPLSLNDRDHWRAHARKVAVARDEARWAIRAARLPALPAAAVFLNWRLPNNRRRDLDNLAASLKPAIDALVDEGVLPDDDWRHVVTSGCRITPPEPNTPASMWLTVTPKEPHP